MHAKVRVDSHITENLEVQNGLRQGCTLAPTLFNIYISAVVANWRDRYEEVGVNVLYKHGRKLLGDRFVKSRLKEVKVTETQLEDDAALCATSKVALKSAVARYEKVASDFGLQLSVEKTNGMAVGQEVNVTPMQVKGGSLNITDHLYVGSNISSDGEIMVEIDCRIAKASRAFQCLRRPIFQNRNHSVATKRQVY